MTFSDARPKRKKRKSKKVKKKKGNGCLN